MPWSSNNNNGGGWKSGGNGGGGGGPWGQGGGGPGGQQPDLEEMLKRSQDRLRKTMGGGSGIPGPLMLLIAAVGIAVVAFYAFTVKINTDELGVVLRFGKFERTMGAGLNYKLPYPIEQVLKPKVTRQNQMLIGFRANGRNFSSGSTDVLKESLMLTGDENIVDIDFVVFWRINNAKDFLFNIQNPVITVKEVAESAMREVAGTKDIQPILTTERGAAEIEVRELMQKTLNAYKAGIEITQLQMKKVDPPKQVIDAFRDVQAARADEERLRNEANAYKNRIIAEAKGQADRITAAAAAYKEKSIADATGQAKRFKLIFDQYKVAKDVTRKRMFLETMERVFRGTDKIILDSSGGRSGVVPYLPLNELAKGKAKAGNQ